MGVECLDIPSPMERIRSIVVRIELRIGSATIMTILVVANVSNRVDNFVAWRIPGTEEEEDMVVRSTNKDGPNIATMVQNIIMAMNRRVRIILENGNKGEDDEG